MAENSGIPGVGSGIPSQNALSVYTQGDAMDDFPVLKAFQQYIDAEQAKARKRMLTMAVFFTVFLFGVIAIFIALMIAMNNRNQLLNDRLVEYAMKERALPVVQPQPQQDNAALIALTTKLNDLQNQLKESQEKAAKAVEAATVKNDTEKQATAAEQQIALLKEQLALEKKRAEEEKKKQHEAEIEAYRRKHYPEYYQQEQDLTEIEEPVENLQPRRTRKRNLHQTTPQQRTNDDIDDLIQDLDDLPAVSYFDETEPNKDKAPAKTSAEKPVKPKAAAKTRSFRIPEE